MSLVDSFEEQNFLAGMIRDYWLMPDIKSRLESISPMTELGLAYYHQRKEMGTFDLIQRGSPVIDQPSERGTLDAGLYAIGVKASADHENWQKTLKYIGTSLFGNKAFETLRSKYEATLSSRGTRNEQIGFCFATDGPGMRVPYEWAVMEGHTSPLCLTHPLQHFLVGSPEPRSPVRILFEGYVAISFSSITSRGRPRWYSTGK